MSSATKLAGFAVALAVVFGGATVAGSAVGPLRTSDSPARAHGVTGMSPMGGAGHGAEAMTTDAVRGLAVSEDGLTLALARSTMARNRAADLSFRVVGRDGQTVRGFDVEHTKRMHLIVVRRDMAGFQHLHPTQHTDGSWSVPLTLRDAGSYRVFADFSVDGKPHTLAGDLQVDGPVHAQPMAAPAKSVEVDGLNVALAEGASHAGTESELGFTVTRDGRQVAVEDYLGAKGHLVALRDGDLAFLHVHPDQDRLRFMATFPSAGRYRLFLQFRVDGRVHTAAFTQEVER